MLLWKILGISLISCVCAEIQLPKEEVALEKIRDTKVKNPPKILIVSFAKIGGHASLTKSITSFLKQNYDIDVLNTEDLERKKGMDYYGKILRNPMIIVSIGQIFHHTFHNFCRTLPRAALNFFYKLDEFKEILVKNKYDLVIFTSPIHLNEINRECIKEKIPCINLIADYGDPEIAEDFWIREECMAYLLPQNSYFKSSKKHSSVKYISGIPIRNDFKIAREKSKQEFKIKLGLDPKVPCALILFGSAGSNEMLEIAQVCKNDKSKQFVFLCGANAELKNRIDQMNCSHFMVRGYVNDSYEYIRAADALITKPGATSITEAIQCETPCIFRISNVFSVSPIEKPTAKYVEEQGFGEVIDDYACLPNILEKVLNKSYIFPKNNALYESIVVIRRMLREKQKWIRRFYIAKEI